MDVAALLTLPVLGAGMVDGDGVVIEELDGVGLDSVALLTFCLATEQVHAA